ncbi:MAG: hypothetical protein ACOYX5_01305 [Actinomycetota bacterium]
MNPRRIALFAALAAATFWAAKATAIGVAGGPGKSPFEDILFLAGLLSFGVAAVALGIAATPAARPWLRALAGLGVFILGFAFGQGVNALVGALHPDGGERHWVWTEFNLWVAAVVVLAIVVPLNRTGDPRRSLA